LFGAAEALREAAQTPQPLYRRANYERDLAAARARLDEAAFAAAWAEGRAMGMEQAVAYARASPVFSADKTASGRRSAGAAGDGRVE
jgi:hypothetical protein